MIESEALRNCPYCSTQETPMLILYPNEGTGSGTTWCCRKCGLEWSDARHAPIAVSK